MFPLYGSVRYRWHYTPFKYLVSITLLNLYQTSNIQPSEHIIVCGDYDACSFPYHGAIFSSHDLSQKFIKGIISTLSFLHRFLCSNSQNVSSSAHPPLRIFDYLLASVNSKVKYTNKHRHRHIALSYSKADWDGVVESVYSRK